MCCGVGVFDLSLILGFGVFFVFVFWVCLFVFVFFDTGSNGSLAGLKLVV